MDHILCSYILGLEIDWARGILSSEYSSHSWIEFPYNCLTNLAGVTQCKCLIIRGQTTDNHLVQSMLDICQLSGQVLCLQQSLWY